MREELRFLVPILLVVSAAAVQGAPGAGSESGQELVLSPTPELPRSWRLPPGWRVIGPMREKERLVEYLSGPTTEVLGRVYSWPIRDLGDTANTARKLCLSELGSGYRPAGVRTIEGVMEFTGLGWSGSVDPRDNKGKPDVAVFGRAARVGNRLVAGVLIVSLEGAGRERDREARGMLKKLRFPASPTRYDAISGWGGIVSDQGGRTRL